MTGREVKAIRERLRWTQQKMAVEVGVSIRTLTRWESGESGVSPLAAAQITRIVETNKIKLSEPRRRKRP